MGTEVRRKIHRAPNSFAWIGGAYVRSYEVFLKGATIIRNYTIFRKRKKVSRRKRK